MLPFFFRHYESWVDRFFIFDDGSSDGSDELIARHPRAELQPFEHVVEDSFVLSARAMYDHAWKQSRGEADWVIVTNLDEHLHHPRLGEYITACADRGVTVIPALGYQMISAEFPGPEEQLCDTRTRGAPWAQMSKADLFVPDAVDEMRYIPGRHEAAPHGDIVYPERDELLNLHYRYMGREFVHQRHGELNPRLGSRDVALEYGHKYAWNERELDADWAAFEARAVDVSNPRLQPWRSHAEPRWWRPA